MLKNTLSGAWTTAKLIELMLPCSTSAHAEDVQADRARTSCRTSRTKVAEHAVKA